MRTLQELVGVVHLAATELGMDVSPKDVAFIISTFLEGLAHHPGTPEVNAPLQAMADDISRVADE